MHPDRCNDDVILQTCRVHCNICITSDLISLKIRLKNQVPEQHDYLTLEAALKNLDYLWKIAGLNYTPKVHSVLAHAMDQMKELEGIGDMLEDDVEHIHQIAARIESRTSRMKNKTQQAFVHSKIEAIQNVMSCSFYVYMTLVYGSSLKLGKLRRFYIVKRGYIRDPASRLSLS